MNAAIAEAPLAGEQTQAQPTAQATPVTAPVAPAKFRIDESRTAVTLSEILKKYSTTPEGKESVAKATELNKGMRASQAGMTSVQKVQDWNAQIKAFQLGRALEQVVAIKTSHSGAIGQHCALAMTAMSNASRDGINGMMMTYQARNGVVAC